MKKKLGFIFLLFTASVSYGQFSDTAALNQYLRDIIKDRRPARITAADLQKGLLGITQFLGNTNIFEGADQYDSLEGTATTRHTLNTATVEAAMGFADIDPRFPLAAKTFVIQGRDKDDNNNVIARPLALNPYKDNFQGYNYVSVGSTTPTAPFSVFDGTNGVGLLFTPSTVSDIAQIAAVNYTENYNTAAPLSLVADGVRISHWNAGLSSASSLTIDGSLALSVRKSFPGGDYIPFP